MATQQTALDPRGTTVTEGINFLRLLQDIRAWNEWRRNNGLRKKNDPDKPDPESTLHFNGADLHHARLAGADLRGLDFIGANLFQANLQGANLEGARFYRADLTGATLIGAAFSGAKFKAADLTCSYLSDARLSGVDLSGAIMNATELYGAWLNQANLSGAHIVGAHLAGADLTGSIMDCTILSDLDLSKVRGLEQVRHNGPSCVGIDTIYRSHGIIPHKFLREAGIRENFIAYMASLVGNAMEYHSCFISFSSKDMEFAQPLCTDLKTKGVDCWFAPVAVKTGEWIQDSIDKGIQAYERLLVILSKNSVESQWVEKEVKAAFAKELESRKQVLFPVRIDDAVMESELGWAAEIRRTRKIADFREWKNAESYSRALEILLEHLQKEANPKLATSA